MQILFYIVYFLQITKVMAIGASYLFFFLLLGLHRNFAIIKSL